MGGYQCELSGNFITHTKQQVNLLFGDVILDCDYNITPTKFGGMTNHSIEFIMKVQDRLYKFVVSRYADSSDPEIVITDNVEGWLYFRLYKLTERCGWSELFMKQVS